MSASRPDWRELHLLAGGDAAERSAEALFAAGALAVTFTDAGDRPILEPPPGTTPLWEQVCITALFDGGVDPDQVWRALAAALGPGALPAGRWTELGERPWAELWREHFRPRHCGGRLWICPSWCAPPDPDAVNLRLDPGLAFGTGDHPTTALCLEWLAGRPLAGARVLDYGCGSGILAIAACLLGAARATAVDIDPQALTATRDNARRNRIAEQRLAVGDPAILAGERYDLILANILANPLLELAPRLAGLAAPGAALCLSGMLSGQWPAVAEAYRPWFELRPSTARGGWVRLAGTRLR
ncbi:MAG: 50S ribosomal protein L11 methyltransferase [Pseudomonadota bacterium]